MNTLLHPARSRVTDLATFLQSLSLADASAKKPKRRKKVVEKREWAHVVDVKQNLMNFDELVPDMAFKVRLRSGLVCNRSFPSLTLCSARR